LEELNARIAAACARSGRDATGVRLVGASKTVPAARLGEFIEAGLRHFGENYCQEGVAKIEALRAAENLPPEATTHFIGALQSNKARMAVGHFDVIHSVDRISLAKAIDKAARESGKVQRVLLQVNVSGEASKGGCSPHALEELVEECDRFEHVIVEGLMALPAYEADAEKVRPSFVALRELRDRWIPGGGLSMGMSNDFEAAIEEGATLVRLGSVLFGARK
jgi:pyridoxal phosphate enzyme (YggS family)